MEQSIASSQGDIDAGKGSNRNPKLIVAAIWSTIVANGLRLISGIRSLGGEPGSDFAETLDIDRIAARLKVENRAEFDGRNDQPLSAEEGVSGTQREIVVYFKALQRKAQHHVVELVNKLRGAREKIDLLSVGGSLRDIPSRCENEVLRLIAESQSQLNFFGEQEAQRQQQYSASLEDGQAKQVSERPASPVIQWIFLAVLTGVAAFAIATISVPGYGSTVIVPPTWSIAISVIIVVVSALTASVMSRAVNQVGQVGLLMGWLAGGLGIALIVLMALFSTHFITVMTANPDVDVQSVVDSIRANPIAVISNISDWKAFGIVIAAGIMAFMVSYRPQASQQGHDAKQSTLYGIRRRRDRLTKRLRMQINAIIDEADGEVTMIPNRLKAQIGEYSKLVEESKRMPANLSDYDVALEDGCNILLERYRSANVNARKSDIPMSFSEHVCFRQEIEPSISEFGEEERRLEQFHQGIAELESDATDVRHKLRDLNARAISTLEDMPASV